MKFLERITSHLSPFIGTSFKKKGKHFYNHIYLKIIICHLQYPNFSYYRIKRYNDFKAFHYRIMVATDIFGRGIDIEKINVVFNYNMPIDSDSYLHRVGRAGRFGTKGLAISFISEQEDLVVLEEIQKRFEVKIEELPTTIDVSTYSKNFLIY